MHGAELHVDVLVNTIELPTVALVGFGVSPEIVGGFGATVVLLDVVV